MIPKLKICAVIPENPVSETWQHGLIWHGVQEIAISLGEAHWYGQGGLVHQQWPLEKLAQYEAPFLTSDNGATGHLGILHPFWFTSTGAGVLVEGRGRDDLITSLNAPLQGQPHDHSFTHPAPNNERPLLAEGRATDGLLRIKGDNLSIRFFDLSNAREVVEAFWQLIEVSPLPPGDLLEKPLWTTWAHFKNDVSHDKVLDFARNIIEHGFPPGILGIDAKWQDEFGSTRFDPAKFPDPAETIAALHEMGMQATLWTMPFFNRGSQHYEAAASYALRGADGSPYIREWWEGEGILLNIADSDAMNWHLGNLQQLRDGVGVDGFKFDAGEGMFYASDEFLPDVPPNAFTHHYIQQVATRFPWSDVRSGWHTQGARMLFRQWDKSSTWGYDNGLASCLTQAMTLNLLGYPYSFPDMIGGNQYFDTTPTAELLIRWTQAVAPMPIIQFSIPPWQFSEECAAICAHYARLHSDLADYSRQAAAQSAPIIRPLWWLAPDDEDALLCSDSYLVGDRLLVAPILNEGHRERDVYLPAGQWCNYWSHDETYAGSQWLRKFPCPLDTLLLFEKAQP